MASVADLGRKVAEMVETTDAVVLFVGFLKGVPRVDEAKLQEMTDALEGARAKLAAAIEPEPAPPADPPVA